MFLCPCIVHVFVIRKSFTHRKRNCCSQKSSFVVAWRKLDSEWSVHSISSSINKTKEKREKKRKEKKEKKEEMDIGFRFAFIGLPLSFSSLSLSLTLPFTVTQSHTWFDLLGNFLCVFFMFREGGREAVFLNHTFILSVTQKKIAFSFSVFHCC